MLKVVVSGPYPPAIVRLAGDRVFAVSGNNWRPIPPNTEVGDLEWDRPVIQVTEVQVLRVEVPSSSNPNEKYTVTIENGKVTWCTCYGYLYRHNCKHARWVAEAYGRVVNGRPDLQPGQDNYLDQSG